jgi:GAF domain-containing protein
MKTSKVAIADEVLALVRRSHALQGNAHLPEVGALVWTLLRRIVPSDSMAIFLPDRLQEHVVVRYAAGDHGKAIYDATRPISTGLAGWVAVNRKPVLNADPSLDLGFRGTSFPALRSCIVTPLIASDAVIAVLALYSTAAAAFSDDHVHVLRLLGPSLAEALVDAVIADEDSTCPLERRQIATLKLVKSS